MTDNIPQDDDITKTQLWKRIDEVFPVIANIKDELYPQILSVKEEAKAQVATQLEEGKTFLQSYDSFLQSRYNETVEKFRDIQLKAQDFLYQKYQERLKELEEKTRETQTALIASVKEETNVRFEALDIELTHLIEKGLERIQSCIPAIAAEKAKEFVLKAGEKLADVAKIEIKNIRASLPSEIATQTKIYLNAEYEKNIQRLEGEIGDMQQKIPKTVSDQANKQFDAALKKKSTEWDKKIKSTQANIPSLVAQHTKEFLAPVQKQLNEIQTSLETFKTNMSAYITDQVQTSARTVESNASSTVVQKIEDHRRYTDSYDAKLESRLNAYTTDIQKIIYGAADKMTKDNQKNIAVLEEKIRIIQASIPQTVIQQTQSFLAPTNTKLASLLKEFEEFKKGLLASTGKFNTEIVSKFSDLNRRLEQTLEKFRKLSSSIT